MSNPYDGGRRKNVTGTGKKIFRRGEGLGTGPVGNPDAYAGRDEKPQSSQHSSASAGGAGFGATGKTTGTGGRRSNSGGRLPLPLILILLAVFVFGGGGSGLLSGLLGGSSSGSYDEGYTAPTSTNNYQSQTTQSQTTSGLSTGSASASVSPYSGMTGSLLQSLFTGGSGMTGMGGSTSTGWSDNSANAQRGVLRTDVAAGSRDKYTKIVGSGKDTVTILVYMCGTDLESKNGMGTNDLQEMLKAQYGSNINVIVYTGGCASWRNNVVSSKTNQIYRVADGNLETLVADAGAKVMTDPNTLSEFIKWGAKNYPANRMNLIFWDHGGGSVSGYGYDEKNPRSGSMSLSGINKALKDGGVKFDFIGFDACLMATMENALMLNNYADYLIGSEETEPGVGWYYTNWLTKLGQNTSMPTIEIGKNIVDDFVDVCAQQCRGQKTTLSVIDLAELANTVPEDLKDFSKSITEKLKQKDYKAVSDARYGSREFATTSRIDQVDLVDLAQRVGTDGGKELAESLKNAVKYNRTSSNMTNAYGISIYFPYQRTSYVDKAVDEYESIGLDSEYSKAIQNFAKVEASGQGVTGGSGSALGSLLTQSGSSYSAPSGSSDMVGQLLSAFLSSGLGSVEGLSSGNSDFFSGRDLSNEDVASYLAENQFDASQLVWNQDAEGNYTLHLSEDQKALVHSVEMNLFYDDGQGYIDMGLDQVRQQTNAAGDLIADLDHTWIAINDQPVAFYQESTTIDGSSYTVVGRVPVLLNGDRANLILVFDQDHEDGYIAGARYDYKDGETDTVAKAITELNAGDTLDFVADYYSYEGQYQDSYMIGEQMTVTDTMTISNVDIGEGSGKVSYRFTDIYNQSYWTEALSE